MAKGLRLSASSGGYSGKHVHIDGLEEMAMTIRTLKTSVARSAVASGVNAGMTVMVRQGRKEVSAQSVQTEHAASLKSGMRKLLAKRFNKGGLDRMGRRHAMVGKVGFGVGKKTEDRMSRGETATHPRRVGVTRSTAHWFVLGTPDRTPGQVPELFEGVIDRAVSASGEAAMQAAVNKAKQRFEVLAAKAAKRKR